MNKRVLFAKIAAIIGAVLVWFTVLSPLLFGLLGLVTRRGFHFDYLMPAEFFLVALMGAALLFLAGFLARLPWRLTAWGIGLSIVFLLALQGVAVVTGLADGSTEMGGWQWALVMLGLGLFWVCLVITGVAGVRLIRSLYQKIQVP